MENSKAHIQGEISENLDLLLLFKNIIKNRKKIYKAMIIGAIIGIIIGFSLPKEYTVKVSLSPESGNSNGGGLAGIASMFGLGNVTSNLNEDALTFGMFPEITQTNPFMIEMLMVKVKTQDNQEILLYDYLHTQKNPWWSYVINAPIKCISALINLFKESTNKEIKGLKLDPFQLTQEEQQRISSLKKRIIAETDKKTTMTHITVSFQDPLVTAIVADSAINKLQTYIINYRTKKAKQDYEFQNQMCEKYKKLYEEAQRKYDEYADANRNLVTQTAKSQMNEYQQNADLAYKVCNQVLTQRQIAEAKLQEAKPVFAVVEPSTIPLNASSPNKPLLLIGFTFLAFVLESAWILFGKDIYHDFKNELKKKD